MGNCTADVNEESLLLRSSRSFSHAISNPDQRTQALAIYTGEKGRPVVFYGNYHVLPYKCW